MACATSTVSYALSLAELEGIVTAWGLSSSGAGKRPGAEAQALRGSLDELVRAHTIIVADAYKLILIAVMIQLSSGYLSAEYVLGLAVSSSSSSSSNNNRNCLLYTSGAADYLICVLIA